MGLLDPDLTHTQHDLGPIELKDQVRVLNIGLHLTSKLIDYVSRKIGPHLIRLDLSLNSTRNNLEKHV